MGACACSLGSKTGEDVDYCHIRGSTGEKWRRPESSEGRLLGISSVIDPRFILKIRVRVSSAIKGKWKWKRNMKREAATDKIKM